MIAARALAVAAALTVPGVERARADVAVPVRAHALSDRGRDLHHRGDYRAAISAYQEAYAIAPSPGLLFNMGQAYRLLGDCPHATSYYRQFLASSGDPEARELARHQLIALGPCRIDVAMTGGDADAAAPGSGKRNLGIALALGGVLVLAGSATFALDANSAAEQVSSAYAHGAAWSTIAPLQARGERSSARALGLGLTGGAVVASGAVLYWLGRRDARRAPRALALVPGAHGARVTLTWSF
ncbi:MAG: tetratricopeptide repeat protein [Deltaproteobacteria bacterium]|nr:tetratricopeptide repeat protein [Deltaproteobacteria bacterium]